MLKRVVKRALTGRSDRGKVSPAQPVAPRPTAPSPTASVKPKEAPTPQQPLSGIAARIAAGNTVNPTAHVKATSGAASPATQGTIHQDEDGNAYWGEVNNESAQAKALGQTLVIDQWECISCGTCVENTDVVFTLPDDAKATVIRQEGDMELIQDAIDACPVTCIHWSDQPGQYEQLNDADGNTIESGQG